MGPALFVSTGKVAFMMDLWAWEPVITFHEAITEGFRGFTWSAAHAFKFHTNPIARFRAACMGAGDDVRFMLIDGSVASEFDMWCPTNKPIARYPIFSFKENTVEDLLRLCSRPVFGTEKHRVLVTGWAPRIRSERHSQVVMVNEMQKVFPECELFARGLSSFDHLFGWNLRAGDLQTLHTNIQLYEAVTLPSGRLLRYDQVYDKRYKDWFELLGFDQKKLIDSVYGENDRRPLVQVTYRSAQWARRNFKSVEPFVKKRVPDRPFTVDPSFIESSDEDFVLPATRRRTLHNLNLDFNEGDRFACDTCILHNNCRLYREGSVCTVKGSEAVALADNFGTRSADAIISGLSSILKRQAERYEDAEAAERAAGKLDPEVTKLAGTLFSNGVKLAKLLDPTLNGGPKVQVNVGVGAGGQANVGVSTADPRQVTAGIVAELEAQGIPREQIDSKMIKGYLRKLGVGATPATSAKQTAQTAKVLKEIEAFPEDYDPSSAISEPIPGEIVDDKP